MRISVFKKPMRQALAAFLIPLTVWSSLPLPQAHAQQEQTAWHSAFSVPSKWGSVQEFYRGRSSKTWLFIQDAHDSVEAQKNIARLIDHFVSNHGIRTVFEEGFEGPVPADDLFDSITGRKLRQKTSYFLLESLRLGGAEYAYINRKKDFRLVGADDLREHAAGIEHYRQAAGRQKEIARQLKALSQELQDAAVELPKPMRQWMRAKNQYEAGTLTLTAYIRQLAGWSLERPDAGLFGLRYPALASVSAALENQTDKDAEALQTLKALDVFEEMRACEAGLVHGWAREPDQEKIYRFDRYLSLLERLNRLAVSSGEYALIRDELENTDTQNLADFLTRKTGKTQVFEKSWEEALLPAKAFYESAMRRDEKIHDTARNFLTNAPDENTAVLVYGGFHGDRIREILKSLGMSYAVISPVITHIDPREQAQYRALMAAAPQTDILTVPAFFSRPLSVFEMADAGPAAKNEIRAQLGRLSTLLQGLEGQLPQLVQEARLRLRTADGAESAGRSEVRAKKDATQKLIESSLAVLHQILTTPRYYAMIDDADGLRAKTYKDVTRSRTSLPKLYNAFNYLWKNGFFERPKPTGPYFLSPFSKRLAESLKTDSAQSLPQAIIALLLPGIETGDAKSRGRTIKQLQYWSQHFPEARPDLQQLLRQKAEELALIEVRDLHEKFLAEQNLEKRFGLIQRAAEVVKLHPRIERELRETILEQEDLLFDEIAHARFASAKAQTDDEKAMTALLAVRKFVEEHTLVEAITRYRIVSEIEAELHTRSLRRFGTTDVRYHSRAEIEWLLKLRGYKQLRDKWNGWGARSRELDAQDPETILPGYLRAKERQNLIERAVTSLRPSAGSPGQGFRVPLWFKLVAAGISGTAALMLFSSSLIWTAFNGTMFLYWTADMFRSWYVRRHARQPETTAPLTSALVRELGQVQSAQMSHLTALLLKYRNYRESFEKWPLSLKTMSRLEEVGVTELWDDAGYRAQYAAEGDDFIQKPIPTHLELVRKAIGEEFVGKRDETTGEYQEGSLTGSLQRGARSARQIIQQYPEIITAIREGTVSLDESIYLLNEIKLHFVKKNSRGEKVLKDHLEALTSDYALMTGVIEATIWDRDPWVDLSRQGEFYCCAFLEGMYQTGVFGYMLSKGVSMMDFVMGNSRKVRAIMTAGIYTTAAGKKAGVLVVDSVEGTQSISPAVIKRAIDEYAFKAGFQKVLYNAASYNATPLKFVSYLRSKGMPHQSLHVMRADDENLQYLEAFPSFSNGYRTVAGTVTGYATDLSRDRYRFENWTREDVKASRVSADDWGRIKGAVLALERSFPERLRETEEMLERKFTQPSGEAFVLKIKDEIVGYAAGGRLETYEAVKGNREDENFGKQNTFYLASLAISPGLNGKGVKKIFRDAVIAAAREKGYEFFAAHIDEKQTRQVDQPVVTGTYSNWYRSGKTFQRIQVALHPETVPAAVVQEPAVPAAAETPEAELEITQTMPADWPDIKEAITRLESVFESTLRYTPAMLKAAFTDAGKISLMARKDGRIVGYVLAGPLEKYSGLPGAADDDQWRKNTTVYSESMVVDPEFQGQGIGTEMQRKLDEIILQKGYRYKTAHRREGIAARVNASVLSRHPNWAGTGRTYEYARTDLRARSEVRSKPDEKTVRLRGEILHAAVSRDYILLQDLARRYEMTRKEARKLLHHYGFRDWPGEAGRQFVTGLSPLADEHLPAANPAVTALEDEELKIDLSAEVIAFKQEHATYAGATWIGTPVREGRDKIEKAVALGLSHAFFALFGDGGKYVRWKTLKKLEADLWQALEIARRFVVQPSEHPWPHAAALPESRKLSQKIQEFILQENLSADERREDQQALTALLPFLEHLHYRIAYILNRVEHEFSYHEREEARRARRAAENPVPAMRLAAGSFHLSSLLDPEMRISRIVLVADNSQTLAPNFETPASRVMTDLLERLVLQDGVIVVNSGDPREALLETVHKELIERLAGAQKMDRFLLASDGGTRVLGFDAAGAVNFDEAQPAWDFQDRVLRAQMLTRSFFEELIRRLKHHPEELPPEMNGARVGEVRRAYAAAMDVLHERAKNREAWEQIAEGENKNVLTYFLPERFGKRAYVYDSGAKMAVTVMAGPHSRFPLSFFKSIEQHIRNKTEEILPYQVFAGSGFVDLSQTSKLDGVLRLLEVRAPVLLPAPQDEKEAVLYLVIGDGGNDLPTLAHPFADGKRAAVLPVFLSHAQGYQKDLPETAWVSQGVEVEGALEVLKWAVEIQGKPVAETDGLYLNRWQPQEDEKTVEGKPAANSEVRSVDFVLAQDYPAWLTPVFDDLDRYAASLEALSDHLQHLAVQVSRRYLFAQDPVRAIQDTWKRWQTYGISVSEWNEVKKQLAEFQKVAEELSAAQLEGYLREIKRLGGDPTVIIRNLSSQAQRRERLFQNLEIELNAFSLMFRLQDESVRADFDNKLNRFVQEKLFKEFNRKQKIPSRPLLRERLRAGFNKEKKTLLARGRGEVAVSKTVLDRFADDWVQRSVRWLSDALATVEADEKRIAEMVREAAQSEIQEVADAAALKDFVEELDQIIERSYRLDDKAHGRVHAAAYRLLQQIRSVLEQAPELHARYKDRLYTAELLAESAGFEYIQIDKPADFVSARPEKNQTPYASAFSLLGPGDYSNHYLYAGLSRQAEGVAMVTNDPFFSFPVDALTRASFLPARFEVTVSGEFTDAMKQELESGIVEKLGRLQILMNAKEVEILSSHPDRSVLRLVMDYNKSVRVKTLMEHFGLRVLTLKRVALGPGDLLKVGEPGAEEIRKIEGRALERLLEIKAQFRQMLAYYSEHDPLYVAAQYLKILPREPAIRSFALGQLKSLLSRPELRHKTIQALIKSFYWAEEDSTREAVSDLLIQENKQESAVTDFLLHELRFPPFSLRGDEVGMLQDRWEKTRHPAMLRTILSFMQEEAARARKLREAEASAQALRDYAENNGFDEGLLPSQEAARPEEKRSEVRAPSGQDGLPPVHLDRDSTAAILHAVRAASHGLSARIIAALPELFQNGIEGRTDVTISDILRHFNQSPDHALQIELTSQGYKVSLTVDDSFSVGIVGQEQHWIEYDQPLWTETVTFRHFWYPLIHAVMKDLTRDQRKQAGRKGYGRRIEEVYTAARSELRQEPEAFREAFTRPQPRTVLMDFRDLVSFSDEQIREAAIVIKQRGEVRFVVHDAVLDHPDLLRYKRIFKGFRNISWSTGSGEENLASLNPRLLQAGVTGLTRAARASETGFSSAARKKIDLFRLSEKQAGTLAAALSYDPNELLILGAVSRENGLYIFSEGFARLAADFLNRFAVAVSA